MSEARKLHIPIVAMTANAFDEDRMLALEAGMNGHIAKPIDIALLMGTLQDRYLITSNRESGLGRYDVMLEPRTEAYDGILMEFKIHEPEEESGLPETVKTALAQIEEKQYDTVLIQKNIPKERIRKYGIAFAGKKVLIGEQKSV